MKVYHYIYSWVFTLLVGLVLMSIVGGGIGILATAIAAALSAPFMTIFCAVMFLHLKQKPSKKELHIRTFIYHLTGSVLTVSILTAVNNEIFPIVLYMLTFGYFVIDSIFFHAYIQRKQGVVEERKPFNGDLLDSQRIVSEKR